MKFLNLIVRILLGLILIMAGINKFIQFLPMPDLEPARQFMCALSDTGIVLPFVAVVEITAGIFIILIRYQALALVVLFPVILSAFLFHLFLDKSGIWIAAIAIIFNIYLLIVNRKKFQDLLKI